jgi:hypothetical protein
MRGYLFGLNYQYPPPLCSSSCAIREKANVREKNRPEKPMDANERHWRQSKSIKSSAPEEFIFRKKIMVEWQGIPCNLPACLSETGQAEGVVDVATKMC